ncbi:hypothetical protein Tco_0969472 [Tanacetum coccineum]
MRIDELHKFCDGTLQSVYTTLLNRLKNLSLGYNIHRDMPLRVWTIKDQKRIKIMLTKIDDVLLKRRIMRSLEVDPHGFEGIYKDGHGVIIMAQPQIQDDVHQDELCPPNKRYTLMDANKKVDLEHPLCPNESKILVNILQNHPLRFSIAASSSLSWIYLGQFWHTLKEDGSKYRLKFILDKKELTLTLDEFRTIFHLPQATYNNHDHFVLAIKFSEMVLFYLNDMSFTLELRSSSNFKITSLMQPWQTLCKMFTKIIVSHYMTAFPEISRRARDKYHNLEDDEMVKSIFNSGKHKDGFGMKIPSWMITDEMKLTENYRMYATVFGVDVPMTQSQPIESTQGTQRTASAPRTPNPNVAATESSAPRKPTVIHFQKVKEHLAAEEIEKLVEGSENVEETEVDNSTLKQDDNTNDPGTRLEPRSYKESPKAEITVVVQPINVNEEEVESAEDDYELKRMEKGKHVEESRNTPSPTPIRSFRAHSTLIYSELTVNDPPLSSTPSSSSPKFTLSHVMVEALPKMVDDHVKELVKTQVLIYVIEGLIMERKQNQAEMTKMIADAIHQDRENLRAKISSQIHNAIINHIPSQVDASVRSYIPSAIRPRDRDDPHDDAHPKGENSVKRQKTSEYETYVFGESSSGQVNESEQDDDEIPTEKVSQDLMDEMSQTVDEVKLHKVIDEMMRQRCTLGDEHQYHIDQMQNFLKNDIVWESRKERLVSPYLQKTTLVVQSYQRDPKAHVLSLVNQDLLYLKKGSSRPEKIVNKCLKKFNPYARYNVEHWKNPHAKIFYIRKQREPGKPKEVIYSNSKIVQIIKTYWELGHEHKFIKEIIARRPNDSIVSIIESNYKNLNKNDIEDMYLLIINGKLGVESYQQKVNLTAPTITFPGIKKYTVFSIISEPVYDKSCKEDDEYLQLFEEEIEEWLKHLDQMRRYEMYVNGRPLGSRSERPK